MASNRIFALVVAFFVTLSLVTASHNTPPVFDFKREWVVREDERIGNRVATVRTRDDDRDQIEYGLEPAVFLDGSSYFRINKRTGEVFLQRSLKGQGGKDYYLYVSAYDGHQTAKIEVYVKVLPSPKKSVSGPSVSRVQDDPMSRPNASQLHRNAVEGAPPVPKLPARKRPSSNTSEEEDESVEDESRIPPPNSNSVDITTALLPLLLILAFVPVFGMLYCVINRRCFGKNDPLKKRKSSSVEGFAHIMPSTTYHPGITPTVSARSSACEAKPIRYDPTDFFSTMTDHKWEFPRHHLRFLGILGEGCFGQVWKCEAIDPLGTSSADQGPIIVAVKTLKENATEKEKKDLLSELSVMKLLNPHPNVVTLLGCCTETDPLFVIMEYVPHGKLQSYLRDSRVEMSYGTGSRRNLTSRDLTAFAYQVAKGMEYLSSKGIIHRDLAARNILVGENKTCKVADFGFARDVIANHVYERKSEGRLPIRWMAPESLYDNLFTTKTDVWSFGVLMWEIVTLGSTPYPGMAASEVMRRVRDGYRLEKPEHCKREMYNIMYYCWDQVPQERPSFTELTRLLDKLLISENEYIELDRFPDHSYYNLTSLSGERL